MKNHRWHKCWHHYQDNQRNNTKMTPLSQITQLGVGCGLGSTQVEVLSFVKTINSKPDAPRRWSFHIFKIADPAGGLQCEAKFWERDARDIPIGQVIEIIDTSNRGPGLAVSEDKNGNVQLDVKSSCEIAFIDGGGHTQRQPQQAPQRQQAPQQQRNYQQQPQQQRQATPQHRQAYQQGQHTQPQQSAPHQRPGSNLGVTVGMAINNACSVLKDGHPPEYYTSPAFSLDVWTIASDIMRVSRMLEADKLADPAKIRHAPRQPQQQRQSPAQHQEPQHDLPHDAEVTRPMNRQSHPAHDQSPLVDAGLDGDDIPF